MPIENPSVVDIKNFLQHGSSTPISMNEMQTFWKSLTEDEKTDYRKSVSKWDGKSEFVSA